MCRRAIDRAELAEKNLKGIEEELQTVGENMKNLEKSAEKAVEREEKLKEKIFSIQNKVSFIFLYFLLILLQFSSKLLREDLNMEK